MRASQRLAEQSLEPTWLLIVAVVAAAALGWADACSSGGYPAVRVAGIRDWGAVYTRLGRAALENGDYHRALRLLDTAVEKGGPPDAFKFRAEAYDHLGRREKAASDVEQYINLKPRDAWGYAKRGEWLNASLDHVKALGAFGHAVKLDRSSIDGHLGLGIAYMALEMYDPAIKEFKEVLSLKPQHPDALINLGVAHMLSGDPSNASTVLRKALQVVSDPRWKEKVEKWLEGLRPEEQSEKLSAHVGPEASGRGSPDTSITRQASLPQNDALEDLARSVLGPAEQQTSQEEVPQDKSSVDTAPPRTRGVGQGARDGGRVSHDSQFNVTGSWNIDYKDLKIKLDMKHSGKRLTGVMHVKAAWGQSGSFPFSGTFDGGRLRASSYEGHVFEGKVSSNGALKGVLKMKNGLQVPVNCMVH